MSIDFSPRFAAGFAPVQSSTKVKTSSEVFDPFAVVRSGAVPESNRFVQALEQLYGIAAGSLTAAVPADAGAEPTAIQSAAPALARSGLTIAQAGTVSANSTVLNNTMTQSPENQPANEPANQPTNLSASPEVSTLSALLRRAAEQNAAGVTRQSAADALLAPWAGLTDKPA